MNANPNLVLHAQILSFLTIRQGQNELEDEYLVRFNAKKKSLEMIGGVHIFVAPIFLKKEIQHATCDVISLEKEKVLVMCVCVFYADRRK